MTENEGNSHSETKPENEESLLDTILESNRNISYRITKGFANIVVESLDDEIKIKDKEYHSAISASRLVLSLAFMSFITTWILDANIGYKLPNVAYAIALSGSMSILFVGTDIDETINENYDIEFIDDEIENPVIYTVVKRFGGVIFFALGFLIQLLVLYFSSFSLSLVSTIRSSIPQLVIPVIGQVTFSAILNLLLVFVVGATVANIFGIRDFLFDIMRYIIIPAILVVIITLIVRQCFSIAAAEVVSVILILLIQLSYIGVILKMAVEDVVTAIRIARKPKEEILD